MTVKVNDRLEVGTGRLGEASVPSEASVPWRGGRTFRFRERERKGERKAGSWNRTPWQGVRTMERRLCLFDEVGLAEGFEIGVFVGQLFQAVVEFDGPADVGVGGGEIAPLGGITAEIELDEGVLGVKGLRDSGVKGFRG